MKKPKEWSGIGNWPRTTAVNNQAWCESCQKYHARNSWLPAEDEVTENAED
jgi:hypothetical protein